MPKPTLADPLAAMVKTVWLCPTCETIYEREVETCGQNRPFVCRDIPIPMPEVREESVDMALRAFNGWPANMAISDIQRTDSTWLALQHALHAALDPEGFAKADRWNRRKAGQ